MENRTVNLIRDGLLTPWGFRLQGGVDVGTPLSIQRVSVGSPSDGELRGGDLLLRIGDRTATNMNHADAHAAIKAAGNSLSLTIQRASSRSPVNRGLQNSSSLSYLAPAVNSYSPVSGRAASPRPLSPRPLPKTEFVGGRPVGPHGGRPTIPLPPLTNAPQNLNTDVDYQTHVERQAISHQPHRTFPLITPSVKVKHDVPTGSYLRHVYDARANSTSPRPNEASMKQRVQETVQHIAGVRSAGSTPIRCGTPDVIVVGEIPGTGAQIVNRQYNSPYSLYSQQNIAETVAGQTGVTPATLNSALLNQQNHQHHHHSCPADVDRPFFNLQASPTYRAIYEEEWHDLNRESLSEHGPRQERVKQLPRYEDRISTLGLPRDRVQQSRSMNFLINSLSGETDF